MNPATLIALAKNAEWALQLAEKSAVSRADWIAINQTAGLLMEPLRALEYDKTRVDSLRQEAELQATRLRAIFVHAGERVRSFPIPQA